MSTISPHSQLGLSIIGPVKKKLNCDYFLIHPFKHVFSVRKRTETVLLSTHNICFG